ncbi:MAG: dihydroorotate dehydrogenase electron transfer subunit [Desulfobulbus sp.]|nr:dihydroorotate dehydrogenase electron transfer subunit [Desulfobulbus sp.]
MSQFQEKSIVVANEHISEQYFRLVLRAPRIAAQARPGQFVMAACGSTLDPLLRRPFSIHRCPGDDTVHLLIKKVGKGTHLLADCAAGETVDLLGPLGKGFQFQPELASALVGGGVGIAPLLFLVEDAHRRYPEHAPIHVFLGAQTGDDVHQLGAEFEQLGCTVSIATDDGSLGVHGLVTAPLAEHISTMHKAYVCGPMPMMAAAAELCATASIPCEVSLESHMACGLGACLGCTVHGADGHYRHVCKHGPVLPAEEVAWIR